MVLCLLSRKPQEIIDLLLNWVIAPVFPKFRLSSTILSVTIIMLVHGDVQIQMVP